MLHSDFDSTRGEQLEIGSKSSLFAWMQLLEHRRVAIAEELELIRG
jgi:hypothetical protein